LACVLIFFVKKKILKKNILHFVMERYGELALVLLRRMSFIVVFLFVHVMQLYNVVAECFVKLDRRGRYAAKSKVAFRKKWMDGFHHRIVYK